MVIAIFAVLEAGWQYIPLDVQVMAETVLRRITKDTQAPFVLYFEIFHMKVGQLAEPTAQILVLDDSTMALLLRAAFQTKSLGSRGPPNGVLTEMPIGNTWNAGQWNCTPRATLMLGASLEHTFQRAQDRMVQ
ncbi:putative amino acid adenylation domain-containing protein [Drepanopeziza brunnea f. sp. 'multigermtubi' MB_m1]|uniref:Putative amino acid adenylation domain-containing protein n=1 Tax=Marssonina brunnea f. sp. multigermtubi (strain MB_m1) TaxID=1072389 RepID=K1WJD5_MARBU|nr:putative amino acid adenylation domain-containing protein [Drepanopeziza brunnea f. sp. 'multigermtubi' MB_m1]EKD17765.1 putative amino acid adenylation domain-containing protein [Drepanopeziza brunnea f. sp. 'multigermtubi' MB_m1]